MNEHVFGKQWKWLKQQLRSSDKFVLTESAYRRIADAMEEYPEQLVYNCKFAKPPSEAVWLEVSSGYEPFSLNTNGSWNTGYLIVDGTIYTLSEGIEDGHYLPQTYVTDLNVRPERADVKKIMEWIGFKSEEELDRAFWGPKLYAQIPERLRKRMRLQHRVRPAFFENNISDWGEDVRKRLDMNTRIVVATFLALNQPGSVITLTPHDTQRRLTGKGRKTYLSHNVVTIPLGKERKVRFNYRKVEGESGSPMPWHKVRGHYFHIWTDRSPHCDHGYGQDPDLWTMDEPGDDSRWTCSGCGGRRVWRTYPNGHGNGGIGMSLHHHVVQG